MFQMATWEYTAFKLQQQIGFLLRNFENLHTCKGPCVRLSDHQPFPSKPKPGVVALESPATTAASPESVDQGARVFLYAEDWTENLSSVY